MFNNKEKLVDSGQTFQKKELSLFNDNGKLVDSEQILQKKD